MRRVIKEHLFKNPPADRKPGTVSISWLEGDDGQELPCPLGEDYTFADFKEVRKVLSSYYGASFTFEPANCP